MIIQNTKIISNKRINNNYYKITIEAPKIARQARPGQFLEVKVNNTYEPLLRKPFSIHRVRSQKLEVRSQIEILYEVVGRGTKDLSQRKAGEYLDVMGPLGNGFSSLDSGSLILVGGGIGIAPLLFLAENTSIQYPVYPERSRGTSSIQVLIGAETKRKILCKNDFKKLGCSVRISTDDGSSGFKGKVTDLLKEILRRTKNEAMPAGRQERRTIYACGPKPMLEEVSKISKRYNVRAEVCLEAYMACGFGVCLGCAVKTQTGYKLVCKDGPVFNVRQLWW